MINLKWSFKCLHTAWKWNVKQQWSLKETKWCKLHIQGWRMRNETSSSNMKQSPAACLRMCCAGRLRSYTSINKINQARLYKSLRLKWYTFIKLKTKQSIDISPLFGKTKYFRSVFFFLVNYENLLKKLQEGIFSSKARSTLYISYLVSYKNLHIIHHKDTKWKHDSFKLRGWWKGLHCKGFLTRWSVAAAGTSGAASLRWTITAQKDKERTEKIIMWNNLHFLLVIWIY